MDGYSQGQLIAESRRAGYAANGKLIERWVTLGLLDQASAIGRSRGKGVDRRWPEGQRQLFLSLLRHHEHARTVRALTNIPIFVWLLWGEDHIPLRQVRRALETFGQVTRDRQAYAGRAWATELVRNLARPGAPARAKQILAEELVDSVRDGVLHETELRHWLVEVVGPADPSAQTDGPRAYELIRVQFSFVARFFDLTDGHFRWARAFYLYGQADYASAHRTLAADPRFGKLHEPFDLEHIANRAANDLRLVLCLGLDGGPSDPATPEALRLETWIAGRARLHTDVDLRRSPMWLPRGVPNAGLDIRVRIDVDSAIG
jgi:hypothetical protein